jgi:carbon storage regulator
MLVIRRRPGESILLGDSIEIEVLEASGSQVKLGIRAPRSVPVIRKEILLVGQQNRTASGLSEAEMKKLVKTLNNSSILNPSSPAHPSR